jgi:hypothetical protein
MLLIRVSLLPHTTSSPLLKTIRQKEGWISDSNHRQSTLDCRYLNIVFAREKESFEMVETYFLSILSNFPAKWIRQSTLDCR